MWIFLNKAFLSLVHQEGDETTLLVRARSSGDLEAAFPGAQVQETPDHDYRFRAWVDRETVALAMAQAIRDIHYTNFKDSIHDPARHEAYLGVWTAMFRYQRQQLLARYSRP
nr:hypothetical protein [uncultured Holophaga sp.]